MSGRKRKPVHERIGPKQVGLHLSLKLHAWLAQMATEDERGIADFLRRLITQEWNRREQAAALRPASPQAGAQV